MTSKVKSWSLCLTLLAALAAVSIAAVDTAGAASPAAQKMIAEGGAPAADGPQDRAAPLQPIEDADIEALMSQMTDEQVRRLLLEKLREEALKQPDTPVKPVEPGYLTRFIVWVQNSVVRLRDRVQFLLSGVTSVSGDLPGSVSGLTAGGSFLPVAIGLLRVAAGFFAAWLVNWFYRRRTSAIRERIEGTGRDAGWQLKASRVILRMLLDLISIAIFIVVTLIIYFTFFEDNPFRRSFLLTYLTALSLVGVLALISRLVISPRSPALRFLPMNDETADYLHRRVIRIAVVGVFGWLTAGMLRGHNISEAFTFLLTVIIGLVIALMIVRMILQKRKMVAELMRRGVPAKSLRALSAGGWHILAIGYVFVFWAVWVFGLLVLGDRATLAGAVTVSAIPLFFFLDWLAGRLLATALGMAKGYETPAAKIPESTPAAVEAPMREVEVPTDEEEAVTVALEAPPVAKWSMDHTYLMLRRGFRFAIAALLFFWILGIWGIELPIARSVASATMRILVTIVVGYIAWEVINVFIERKLRTIQAGPEGGGAGGNRFRTLVQLGRKFILVVLATMVSLIVLSSMGIEIAPLLAGAGVVGLAIGFGSQALVKDIISGVFFLMDDAFRIGDYIDTGSLKGVVENISIRSLRLRHHRGMVHTIPFGDLKQVTNWTRDWVIMKLEFRVPFDTDVDEVRKIVKKIDKKIAANLELGPKLLDKIKSQGVKEYDDSAIVMRIKFKTRPGEQFSIRKEVYKQLREQFEKAGIEFATRKVMVQLPQELEGDEELKKKAAAAAEAALGAQAAQRAGTPV